LIITETETIFTEATTTDQVISSRFTSTTSQKEYLMSNSEQKFGRCGALMDVFLARRRNARGRRFGFVRFSKVRDKEKMVRALNQVWFGTFKVYANIAAFKRSEEKREEGGVRVETSEKMTEKGKGVVVGEGNKEGNNEGVGMKETFVAVVENGQRLVTKGVNNIVTEVEKSLEKKEWCVRWSSKREDRRWASNGVVGVVRNGVDLSAFSESIVNAGFESLSTTYMSGTKFFINGSEGVDVLHIL
jgi:hypothetical protein